MNFDDSHRLGFRAAIKVIDSQRRLLIEAGADAQILKGFEAIVRHLHRMPESQIERLLGRGDSKGNLTAREKAIQEAGNLSLSEVDRRLNDDKITRAALEAIAIGRFHVPRGSMRSLGNMELLRQKIQTLVENERMHAAISKVAKSSQ